MHATLTDARCRELDEAFARREQPITDQVNAALDRFAEPLIAHEVYTGQWPHVLRFPRPVNDVEGMVQATLFHYTLERATRPVLIEHYNEPRHLREILAEPRPIPSPAARRASVSARAAWREAKRMITPRRKLRLVKC